MGKIDLSELKKFRNDAKDILSFKKISNYADFAIKSLGPRTEVPATTENKFENKLVWQLWLQGYESSPPLIKTCFESVDRNFQDYKINRLTFESISDYLDLPAHLYDKYNSNKISPAHFSDLVRANLLAEHGGTWIDATVWISSKPRNELFSPMGFFAFSATPVELGGSPYIRYSNWFMSAQKGSRTFKLISLGMGEYWKRNDKLTHYYQFHFMHSYISANDIDSITEHSGTPFISNVPPHYLQYSLNEPFTESKMKFFEDSSSIHKLSHYGVEPQIPSQQYTFFDHLIS